MNRFARWTALSGLVGTLVLGAAAGADEENIPVDKLPAAVLKAAKAKFPKAKIEEAAKEVEDGVTTYEVSLKVEGHGIDLTLKPDGTIVEIEKEIAADTLPEAVKATLAAKYPNEKIKKAEEITQGENGPISYEVDLGSVEVVLDAKGKIVKTENDDDDEKEAKPAKGK
ncbi:PepSY-like domain-containing protein [Singulisphaera sp. Ch08]|uniref:PepSY-like domain-containing protein n=1 Tax=Singulisphaera sp. Ch08 TaxID=3120278 RepID=A0AAU7CII8_9BACT